MAARDLITRKIDPAVDSTVVSFQGFASLVIAGPVLLWLTGGQLHPFTQTEGMMMAGGILFGAVGYYGIVAGMRIGDASAVTPFRYTRLIFSIIMGVLIFGERPDLMTMLGASLIIGTGLYTFLRERRLAQQQSVVG